MKKLLSILFIFLPFISQGQKINVAYRTIYYSGDTSFPVLTEISTLDTTGYRLFNQPWFDPVAHRSVVWNDSLNYLYTGAVTQVKIRSGGTGYSSPPTISVTGGGGGSGFTATCTVSGGAVNSVTITAAGNGYYSSPIIKFSGGGGSGASAYPIVSFAYPHEQYNTSAVYPIIINVDGGVTNLYDTLAYYCTGNDGAEFSIYYGSAPGSYPNKWFDTITTGYQTVQWVIPATHMTTRYYQIKLYAGTQISQFALYGDYISGSPPPSSPTVPMGIHYIPYGQGDGFGAYIFDPPQMIMKGNLGKNVRMYESFNYIDTSTSHNVSNWQAVIDKYSQSPTPYTWTLFDSANTQSYYPFYTNTHDSSFNYAAANGQDLWYSFEPGYYNGYTVGYPIDSSQNPLYSDNPDSAKAFYRLGWDAFQDAATVGFENGPIGDTAISYPKPALKYWGKGVADKFETGNETDGTFGSLVWQYQALAAYQSELYDGGGGGVNPNIGFKNGCPGCQIVNFGTFYQDTAYYQAAHYYWYKTRPGHDDAMDIPEYHDYLFNGVNRALSPEEMDTYGTDMYHRDWNFVNFIGRNFPKDSIIIKGEFGYGTNSYAYFPTNQSVIKIPGVDSATVQGEWTARAMLIDAAVPDLIKTPFASSNDLSSWNDGQSMDTAENVRSFNSGQGLNVYNTYGWFLRGQDGSDHRFQFTKPVFWYMKTQDSLLKNYVFQKWLQFEGPDSVEAEQFENVSDTTKKIWAVWSGTISGTNHSTYPLTLGAIPSSSLSKVVLANYSATGTVTTVSADPSGNYSLTNVGETPQFLAGTINSVSPPPPTSIHYSTPVYIKIYHE